MIYPGYSVKSDREPKPFCVRSLFCYSALYVHRFDGEDRTGCFTLMFFLKHCGCYCSVALPHGAVGWSAVCDCGIF